MADHVVTSHEESHHGILDTVKQAVSDAIDTAQEKVQPLVDKLTSDDHDHHKENGVHDELGTPLDHPDVTHTDVGHPDFLHSDATSFEADNHAHSDFAHTVDAAAAHFDDSADLPHTPDVPLDTVALAHAEAAPAVSEDASHAVSPVAEESFVAVSHSDLAAAPAEHEHDKNIASEHPDLFGTGHAEPEFHAEHVPVVELVSENHFDHKNKEPEVHIDHVSTLESAPVNPEADQFEHVSHGDVPHHLDEVVDQVIATNLSDAAVDLHDVEPAFDKVEVAADNAKIAMADFPAQDAHLEAFESKYPVPYRSKLTEPFEPGQTLIVKGKTGEDSVRVTINLHNSTADFSGNDVPLHISIRFDEGKIVFNTFSKGEWGKEERKSNPYKKGDDIDIRVRAHDSKFQIFVDQKEVKEYEHRVPLSSITHFSIDGDVLVTHVHWGGKYYPVPYESGLSGEGFSVGKSLYIFGTPEKKGKRFHINLLKKNGDIALHFNVRFDEKAVVRNSLIANAWGNEEREGKIPFEKATGFDLEIKNEDYAFQIFVDGERFASYAHRLTPRELNGIQIGGDVEITGIQLH